MKITHAMTSRRGSGAPQTQQASNQVKDGVVWVYSYTWKGQVRQHLLRPIDLQFVDFPISWVSKDILRKFRVL